MSEPTTHERSWRRIATYLHLQDLVAGRDVVEVWSAMADPRGWQTLAARGAKQITVVSPQAATGPARDVRRVTGDARATTLAAASVELLFALDVDATHLASVIVEARRVLRPDGVLVLGVTSRDRPGATVGASYYDVIDACADFPQTRMLGVAPFAGTTLVEYGVKDPEPILDGTLVERGERVDHYVAVAGPQRRADFGYGVVQIPAEASVVATDDAGLRSALARAEARVVELSREVSSSARAIATPAGDDKRLAELRRALDLHAAEMRSRQLELAERDAYIKELEGSGRQVHELEGRLLEAETQRAEIENNERTARKQLAELQGQLRSGGGLVAEVAAVGGVDVEALKKKLADAESESWKHMRARSEAEANATALREDNQRKLKDARKLATVELMRAMEEATKKAVSLRDDLERSERLRRAAQAELEALKKGAPAVVAVAGVVSDEATQRRDLARAKEETEAAARAAQAAQARALKEVDAARHAAEGAVREAEVRADQLRDRLRGVEHTLAEIERERDAAREDLAIERARVREGSATMSESAVERGRLEAQRERALQEQTEELVQLRGELVAQARKLTELERDRPSRGDVERMRAELDQMRARAAEHVLELARRDAIVERTAAAHAHERARAERLVADGRQALAERNDARARIAESTARVAGLESDRERAVAALAHAEQRAHKAENDIKEKRDRIRQLKRELEDSERRADYGIKHARTLDTVRARVQALETAVLTEVTRLTTLESALRS